MIASGRAGLHGSACSIVSSTRDIIEYLFLAPSRLDPPYLILVGLYLGRVCLTLTFPVPCKQSMVYLWYYILLLTVFYSQYLSTVAHDAKHLNVDQKLRTAYKGSAL